MKNKFYFLACLCLLNFSAHAQLEGYAFERKIGLPLIRSKADKIKIASNQYLYLMSGVVLQKATLTGVVLKQWGGAGSGKGKFTGTKDMATDKNSNVFVLDNNLIQKFDADGNFVLQWTVPSASMRMYINSDIVYVLESGKISKYAINGDFLSELSVIFTSSPNYFCVDKNENYYVSQTYGVSKYNSSGVRQKDFGYWTFSGPGEIEIDINDNLYVEDNFNKKINVYTQTSVNFTRAIGASGYGPAYFQNIASFTFDASNNIYVNDNSNTNSGIQKFNSSGTFKSLFSYLDFVGNGYLYGPTHVAVDSEFNIYISDLNYLIQKFSPTGKFIRQWGGKGNTDITFGSIGSLSVDANDNIVVADAVNNLVKHYDKNGNFIRKYNGYDPNKVRVFSSMNMMDVDMDGNHYVLDYGTIRKHNQTGGFLKLWGGIGYNDGEFSTPIKTLTVSDSGFVYVLDRYYINKFDTSGNFISIGNYAPGLNILAALDSNQILAFDSDGYLIKYGEDGSFLNSQKIVSGVNDGEFLSINEMKQDRAGKLYFVDAANYTVQVYSSAIVTSIIDQSKKGANNAITVYPNPSGGRFKVNTSNRIVLQRVISTIGETETFYSNEIETSLKGMLIVESHTIDGKVYRAKVFVE